MVGGVKRSATVATMLKRYPSGCCNLACPYCLPTAKEAPQNSS
jgi:sulfatase maturation enzyme AslB (radical SAM superfamily)